MKLASGLVLLGLLGSMFLSLRTVQSIDESFDGVVTIDQPRQEAATDMIGAADAAAIGFLESLVSNKDVSSKEAENAFDRHLTRYRHLVLDEPADDRAKLAHDLFGRLNRIGHQLVTDDLSRQRSFAALQQRFERMDDVIDGSSFLSSVEGDLAEATQWVGNYVAAPSPEYKEQVLEETEDFARELAGLQRSGVPNSRHRAVIRGLLSELQHAKRAELQIVSLTERSEEALPRFLSSRARLDAVLNDGIDQAVHKSLQQRSGHTRRVLDASKAVLVASLIMGALLGFGALVWIRRRITRPVTDLIAAIGALGGGHIPSGLDLAGNDEFGILGRALTEATAKRVSLEQQLRHQALHDPLTGLANRALFYERMEHALVRARRRTSPVSVLFIDVDRFKMVNDTFGHETGDDLLMAVAERLREALRAEDTVARLGGDEFGVLLEEAGVVEATQAAERLAHALGSAYCLRAGEVLISASVGVATQLEGEETDNLLRRADEAMYTAKARGKGLSGSLEPGLAAHLREAETLKAELQRAVEREEFVIHYQPVVDLQTEGFEGVEALVRWNHPERGLLPPSEFIEAAEKTGHILYIDRWVLQEACRQVRVWQQSLPGAARLSACVNLSARQLQHPGLAEEVNEALRNSGLAPQDLTLEITETVLVGDTEAAATELGRLKELGVQLALDDFGTGYSSLSYLRRFPIDVIKIDRSFVSHIGEDTEDSELALALVKLSKSLRLRTVAEGIEEPNQLEPLRSLGCELGQGYYFSRPLDSRQLETFFSRKLQLREA